MYIYIYIYILCIYSRWIFPWAVYLYSLQNATTGTMITCLNASRGQVQQRVTGVTTVATAQKSGDMKGYKGISTKNMALYGTNVYLHFRILKFPLMIFDHHFPAEKIC